MGHSKQGHSPGNWRLELKRTLETTKHSLPKCRADPQESMVGACLPSCGTYPAVAFIAVPGTQGLAALPGLKQ